jgi:hypothetical protein
VGSSFFGIKARKVVLKGGSINPFSLVSSTSRRRSAPSRSKKSR